MQFTGMSFFCKRLWISRCLRYWKYPSGKDCFSAADWVGCSCMLRSPPVSAMFARALLWRSVFHYDSIKTSLSRCSKNIAHRHSLFQNSSHLVFWLSISAPSEAYSTLEYVCLEINKKHAITIHF